MRNNDGKNILLICDYDFLGKYALSALSKIKASVKIYTPDENKKINTNLPGGTEYIGGKKLTDIDCDSFDAILVLVKPAINSNLIEDIELFIKNSGHIYRGKFVYIGILGSKPNARTKNNKKHWDIENAIRCSNLNFIILKPSLIFGGGDDTIEPILKFIDDRRFISFSTDYNAKIQPIWVGDVIKTALYAIISDDINLRTFELGGPEAFNIRSFIEKLSGYKKKKSMYIPVSQYLSKFSIIQKITGLNENIQNLEVFTSVHTCKLRSLRKRFHIPTISLDEYLKSKVDY
jgi:hypothetical protein